MKPVSMKREKDDEDDYSTAPIEAMAPDYPYGLCIHLGPQELKKLGMKELPQVGTEFPLAGVVKVTRTEQSAAEGEREESRSVTLQITDLAVG